MRRRNRILNSFGGIFVLSLILLSGCSKDTVDYLAEGSEAALLRNEEEIESEKWEEQFSAPTESGYHTYNINIEAEISLPQSKGMSVVEVSEPEFDEAYQEQMIKAVFEEAKVSRQDAEPEQIFEEWLNNNGVLNGVDPNELLVVKDADAYLGKRDGISYSLKFVEYMDCYNARAKAVIMEPEDLKSVCPEKLREDGQIQYYYQIFLDEEEKADNVSDSNPCRLTEEEAETLAEKFLAQFDLPEMIKIGCSDLMWQGDAIPVEGSKNARQINSATYGYAVIFQPGINDVTFPNFLFEIDAASDQLIADNTYATAFPEEEEPYSLDSRVEILVADEGIIGIQIDNPLVLSKVVGNVQCLSKESIKGIIKDELKNNIDLYAESTEIIDFNLLQLGYLRIRDSEAEKHYSYIPAWRLVKRKVPAKRNGKTYSETFGDMNGAAVAGYLTGPAVYVNAIDGSIIWVPEIL